MTSGRLVSWYSVQPWSCWSLQARRLLTVTATTSASTALGSGHSVGRSSTKPTRALGESMQNAFAVEQIQSLRLWMPLGLKARTIPNAHGNMSSGNFQLSLLWKRELEDPALLILARAPVAAITSEAPVAKTRDQHITQVAGDVPLTGLERQGLPSKRRRVGLPSPDSCL